MYVIDKLAYGSKLKNVSPTIKTVFSLSTLFACLVANNILFSLVVFIIMSYACVSVSGLGTKRYIQLCAIPFWFVLIGVITIAINYSKQAVGLVNLEMFGGYLSITKNSLTLAIGVFLKSMANISCLYFIYVTTPMNDIIGLLNRLKVPQLFIELMMMIYRFIFLLLNIMEQIATSQKSRLANINYNSKMRSATTMGASVFVKAFKKSTDILNAMESRGYDGTFRYTGVMVRAKTKQKVLLGVYVVVLVAIVIILRVIWGD